MWKWILNNSNVGVSKDGDFFVLNPILIWDDLNVLYLDWGPEGKSSESINSEIYRFCEIWLGRVIRNWKSFRDNQNLKMDTDSFLRGTFSAVLQWIQLLFYLAAHQFLVYPKENCAVDGSVLENTWISRTRGEIWKLFH